METYRPLLRGPEQDPALLVSVVAADKLHADLKSAMEPAIGNREVASTRRIRCGLHLKPRNTGTPMSSLSPDPGDCSLHTLPMAQRHSEPTCPAENEEAIATPPRTAAPQFLNQRIRYLFLCGGFTARSLHWLGDATHRSALANGNRPAPRGQHAADNRAGRAHAGRSNSLRVPDPVWRAQSDQTRHPHPVRQRALHA